jgi:hypothetical protein
MSDSIVLEPKAKTAPPTNHPADQEAFARVEKWMEIIREVASEQVKN